MPKLRVPKFTEDRWDWIHLIGWLGLLVMGFSVAVVLGKLGIPPPF